MPESAELAIIGPVPPPHGGVAVHVERFLPYLDAAGIRWKLYNPSGPTSDGSRMESVARGRARWFARYLLTGREKTIHLHTSHWTAWAAIAWWSRVRGKRVVLSVHSAVSRVFRGSAMRRRLASRGLRCASAIIAVNEDIRTELIACGVDPAVIHVVEPFIPPAWGVPGEGVSTEAVAFCARHSPVLLATGGAVLDEGVDVYGMDMALDLVERLRETHPQIGLLWYLLRPLHRDRQHEEQLVERTKAEPLQAHVLVEIAQGPMYNAYKLVDGVIRPTSTDGDPLTVREAHAAGVPTLVSDVCPRPAESVVFSSRDLDAFEQGVESLLLSAEEIRERLQELPVSEAPATLIKILQSVLHGPNGG